MWKLIFAEIRFRSWNFLLSLLAVSVAAMLFIVGPTLIAGYATDTRQQLAQLKEEAEELEREVVKLEAEAEEMQEETEVLLSAMDRDTKRIMRDLGVNLRIVHKDTSFGSLYTDFVAVDFPEEYVTRLAEAPQIEKIVHLVATLQDKIKWNQRTALLVGKLPMATHSQKNAEKAHMMKAVEQGTVLVGHELGMGLKEGETIEIEGKQLKVAKVMPEYGGLEDVQLLVHLHDAQEILGKPDRINQIMALNCHCKGDRLSVIRAELEGVLPDTKVTEHKTRAEAREKQRDLVEATRAKEQAQVRANLARIRENRDRQLASYQRQEETRNRQLQTLSRLIGITTPLAVLVSAIFVALMTWLNVRERRPEIGVLRAVGRNAMDIATLFLGKALVMGLMGGAVGVIVAYFLTPAIGSATMDIPAGLFAAKDLWVWATLLGAPLITVMAAYVPTLVAISQDPATVLMDN
jgi:hypothetical protein